MATVYQEKQRRERVRAAFQRICDALSNPNTTEPPAWSRRELFQVPPGAEDNGDRSFQIRFISRMLELGILEVDARFPISGRKPTHYRAVDAERILQALENEEALSALIWARAELGPVPDTSSNEQASTEDSAPEADTREEADADEEPSGRAVQEALLKMVFGLVENIHYMREKLDSVERRLGILTGETKPAAEPQANAPAEPEVQ